MRPIPECAVAFIKEKEDRVLTAYEDVGGVWTVGYGHTGPEVTAKLAITPRQADLYLKQDLNTAAAKLAKVVKADVLAALTENQYAALLSFVFNVGAKPGWTIWRVLNARDFDHAPAQLMRFVYVGKKKVQGLVNRRSAEVALWSTQEPGSIPDQPSSAATRIAETPPLPQQPVPASQAVAVILAGAGGVAEAARKVMEAVQPFADKSSFAQQALGYAATVGAAAAVVVALLMWLQARRRTA